MVSPALYSDLSTSKQALGSGKVSLRLQDAKATTQQQAYKKYYAWSTIIT